MITRLISFVVAVLLLSATTMVGAQTVVDQTLFLTFVPNIQFAPVYVAIEKGYFADVGINLSIIHGDEPLGVDLIAAGEHQFGIISGEQIIAARANARPVTFVYEWFQHYPIALVTPNTSGIESVADMVGRRVGVPGRFGATYSGLIAMLTANNLTESEIDLREIGFNAPEVICVGGVDAAAVYVNNEPLVLENLAAAGDCGDVTGINVFPVADFVDIVSNGLITNEDTIENDPELVRSMVSAFDHGLRDVLNNPAEAYLISSEYIDNLPMTDELRAALENVTAMSDSLFMTTPEPSLEDFRGYRDALRIELGASLDAEISLQMNVLLTSSDLWQGDDALGYTDPESWVTTAETLITMGFLDEIGDLSGAYTNVFLPETE